MNHTPVQVRLCGSLKLELDPVSGGQVRYKST